MQAAQIGGVVPREMKYGVVCEPFLPSNPIGKVDLLKPWNGSVHPAS